MNELKWNPDHVMRPGREMDALIASEIFGIKSFHCASENDSAKVKDYSTSILSAMDIINKIQLDNSEAIIEMYSDEPGIFWCRVILERQEKGKLRITHGRSDISFAHAICLAVLENFGIMKIYGVKDHDENF